jgi:VWFA-related protein
MTALAAAFILAQAFPAQQLSHTATAINVEVPVRVFQGDRFVDHLTINDFQVFENGILQAVEAVYLIKKTDIRREEGDKAIRPRLGRTFVLLFAMREWLPELANAMGYFIDNVILPGDMLEFVTPVKPYRLKPDVLAKAPKDRIKDEFVKKIKNDIIFAGSQETNLLAELRQDAAALSLQTYRSHLDQLEQLRKMGEQDLLAFARELKKLDGQKTVFLFYQKELLPQVNLKKQMETQGVTFDDPAFLEDMADLLEFYKREPMFSVDTVKKAYSDSSMSIHFLFITKNRSFGLDVNEVQQPDGVIMVDKSEDIFSAFNEIAQATGGITESSFNIGAAFQKAVDASENYYLLYYRPKDYKADGKFKEIKVTVKTGGYRVTHRAGYFAN